MSGFCKRSQYDKIFSYLWLLQYCDAIKYTEQMTKFKVTSMELYHKKIVVNQQV